MSESGNSKASPKSGSNKNSARNPIGKQQSPKHQTAASGTDNAITSSTHANNTKEHEDVFKAALAKLKSEPQPLQRRTPITPLMRRHEKSTDKQQPSSNSMDSLMKAPTPKHSAEQVIDQNDKEKASPKDGNKESTKLRSNQKSSPVSDNNVKKIDST